MQRKFLTNLALLLFVNLLVKPFWVLGIDRNVQNVVGPESYGFYFVILNASFIFNILLDFGITNFNNRNIAQNNHLLNKHLSGILVLKLLLAVIYVVVTLAFGLIMNYNASQFKLLAIVGLNQFFVSFILYLRSNISGLHLFKTDSFLSVLDRSLMIIICSFLLWGNIMSQPFKIEWFVYAQTLAYILTLIVALFIVIKKAAFVKLSWNLPFFLIIIRQSLPFAILILLMSFYNRIDAIMMEKMLRGTSGEYQAGIYASAYRLLDAVNMIALLFAGLLLPIFSKMLKNSESVEKLVKLSFTLLFTGAVIVAFSSAFYSYELMDLLYTGHKQESANIYKILMFGFIAISTTYVFGTLLTANGSLKQLNIIAGTGMIINILLNLYLIPKFMAIGSAWASLFTQFLTVAIQVILVVRLFKFRINHKYLLTLLIYLIGVILIGYGSEFLSPNWIINISLMVVCSVALAMISKLINIKSLLEIIKKG